MSKLGVNQFEEDETETLLQTNDIAQMDLDDHSTNNQEDLIQVCFHYFQMSNLLLLLLLLDK